MKRPTKPPLPPAVPHRSDVSGNPEPTSGRARKDVAYTPSQGMPAVGPASTRSVSPMRAPPQLPSQVGQDSDDPYDLLEDLATPPIHPPTNLTTGPIQPLQAPPMAMPMPMPPPSSRSSGMQAAFAPPPSQRGPVTAPPGYHSSPMSVGPMSVGPMSQGPISVGPMSQPGPHSSGPMSIPGQQITGPHVPVMQQPTYSTGSYPTGASGPPSSSRTGNDQVPDEGVPLGYVVASAFFLAIALVGFGLYLAFEVISL